jgi:hypothetical protein
VKKPRASANGRRWSARGFFQRKSYFGFFTQIVFPFRNWVFVG